MTNKQAIQLINKAVLFYISQNLEVRANLQRMGYNITDDSTAIEQRDDMYEALRLAKRALMGAEQRRMEI